MCLVRSVNHESAVSHLCVSAVLESKADTTNTMFDHCHKANNKLTTPYCTQSNVFKERSEQPLFRVQGNSGEALMGWERSNVAGRGFRLLKPSGAGFITLIRSVHFPKQAASQNRQDLGLEAVHGVLRTVAALCHPWRRAGNARPRAGHASRERHDRPRMAAEGGRRGRPVCPRSPVC